MQKMTDHVLDRLAESGFGTVSRVAAALISAELKSEKAGADEILKAARRLVREGRIDVIDIGGAPDLE